MLPARCRTGGRFTGNIRSRGGRRFLGRFSLSTLPCARLFRRCADGLTGRRLRLHRRVGLRDLRRPLALRAMLRRGRGFRARQVRASRFWRFWFGRLRFFRGRLLFLW